ncbi:MAG: hypothetical protein COX07_09520 [Bacteroidetes bacterium CG23_combo_of_CG06-09_8_20_14_all_32_9]|nr:MAG: hypothetical protein COX07_09520 [Bacteroidetes bacterium CG23_combo_of_CG06-09_8_20_14_all_32_9]
MKKLIFIAAFLLAVTVSLMAQQYEYNVVTSIESIVPMGIGRSRIVQQKQPMDVSKFTTSRTSGKDSKQGDVNRSETKIDNFDETKLLNFYSGVGINFQNIASNDALITSKLNQMSTDGWELFTVVSGVESDAGKDDRNGIFITRYVFRRLKK